MYYNAKIKIEQRTSKNGEPYQILNMYLPDEVGELVPIHEIYLKQSLADILEYFIKKQELPNEKLK